MTSTMSTARQETTVGEGFALGCVAVGRESFNGPKMSIEFAFEHAWRSWPYGSRFPAVRGDIQRNRLIGIIDRSPRRRSSRLAGWASEWPFVPYIAEGWQVDEVAEVLSSDGGVPLEEWRQLAHSFLDHFDGAEEQSH
jgi:hypothetical protein